MWPSNRKFPGGRKTRGYLTIFVDTPYSLQLKWWSHLSMRKAKIQKAWRNICEVVVLIVFMPCTTLTAHVRSHFPCYELKHSSGDKGKSSFSCLGFSFRIVCLLYPTYYIVKVDPFPRIWGWICQYHDLKKKWWKRCSYIYIYIQWSLKRCILSLKKQKPCPRLSCHPNFRCFKPPCSWRSYFHPLGPAVLRQTPKKQWCSMILLSWYSQVV